MTEPKSIKKGLSILSKKISKIRSNSGRVDHSDVMKPAEHVHHILRDPVLSVFFKVFMERQYCSESLACWLEIQDFKCATEQRKMKMKAKHINGTYICKDAIRIVNLDDMQRDHVVNKILSDSISLAIFDEVEESLFAMMVNDTYHKFISSPSYADYLQNEPQPSLPRSPSLEMLERYHERNTVESPRASEAPTLTRSETNPPQATSLAAIIQASAGANRTPPLLKAQTMSSIPTNKNRAWTRSIVPPSSQDTHEQLEKFFLVFDFEGEGPTELSLKECTIVEVIDKHRTGWTKVKVSKTPALVGWVPSSWLDPIDSMEKHIELYGCVCSSSIQCNCGSYCSTCHCDTSGSPKRIGNSRETPSYARETILGHPSNLQTHSSDSIRAISDLSAGKKPTNNRGRALPTPPHGGHTSPMPMRSGNTPTTIVRRGGQPVARIPSNNSRMTPLRSPLASGRKIPDSPAPTHPPHESNTPEPHSPRLNAGSYKSFIPKASGSAPPGGPPPTPPGQ